MLLNVTEEIISIELVLYKNDVYVHLLLYKYG